MTLSDTTRSYRHRLLQFGAICLIMTWGPWFALAARGVDVDEGPAVLVFTIGACGPSLAALFMWLRFRGEGTRTPIRASWKWPVVALVLGAAPPILAALLRHTGDLSVIGDHASSTVASVGGPLGVIAYTLLAGPLSEEFGWRGYVQPRLRQQYGRLRVTGLLGAVWGLWHVPLFLLNGTGQNDIGLFSTQGALFFIVLFPLTYVMLFVSEHLQGGVWAAILVHAAWNASDALMPEQTDAGAFLCLAVLLASTGLVAAIWRRRDSDPPGLDEARPLDNS